MNETCYKFISCIISGPLLFCSMDKHLQHKIKSLLQIFLSTSFFWSHKSFKYSECKSGRGSASHLLKFYNNNHHCICFSLVANPNLRHHKLQPVQDSFIPNSGRCYTTLLSHMSDLCNARTITFAACRTIWPTKNTMQEICTTWSAISVNKNTHDGLFYCRWYDILLCAYDWYVLHLGWSDCKMENAKSPYKFQFLACTLYLCHPLVVFVRWLCCGKQQNIRNDIFSRVFLCKYF